jgi:hypothetical protein
VKDDAANRGRVTTMKLRSSLILPCGLLLLLMLFAAACDDSEPTAAADWVIEVTASPASLDLDAPDIPGSSTITAVVFNTDGQPQSGIGVRFSASAGTMASGGGLVKTNERGEAQDVLTTNADSKVRVKSGSAEGTVDVKINSTNEKPTAVISIQPRDQAPIGSQVTFSGSSSEDLDGEIVEYRWSIASTNPDPGVSNPDDEVTASTTIIRTYNNPQDLTVSLTTVDNKGATASTSATYFVLDNLPPTVDAGPPQTGIIGSSSPYTCSITLCPVSSDPDGQVTAYQFSWGDSDTPVLPVGCQNHTYLRPSPTLADYKVVVTAYDNGNKEGACLAPPPPGGFDTCTSRKTATDSTVITCPAAAR